MSNIAPLLKAGSVSDSYLYPINTSDRATNVPKNNNPLNNLAYVSSQQHALNLFLLGKLGLYENNVSTSVHYHAIEKIVGGIQKQLENSQVVKDIVLDINDFTNNLREAIIEIRSNPETNTSEAHEQLYKKFYDDMVNYLRSRDDDFIDTVQNVYAFAQKELMDLGLNTTQLEKAEERLADAIGKALMDIYGNFYHDIGELIKGVKEYKSATLHYDPLYYALLSDEEITA